MNFLLQCSLPILLLVTCACSTASSAIGSKTAPKRPILGGIAEFKLGSFDGRTLKGRLLLGATVEALVIDGRLVEWMIVEPKKIRRCDTNTPLEYYQMDILIGPPTDDQIVTIQPGYWYGVDLDFLLFGSQIKEPKPDCFEGELVVKALDRRIAATLPIRVSRTDAKNNSSASPAGEDHKSRGEDQPQKLNDP